MMIKVNGIGFLDLYEDVEMSSQAKLFSDLSSTSGDFSYEINIPDTTNNVSLLGLSHGNVSSKKIYNKVDAEIISDDGIPLYIGYLRVQKFNNNIHGTFFSGNSNWIAEIVSQVTDVDFSDLDADNTLAVIEASWGSDSGMVFPLVDKGLFSDRLFRCWVKYSPNGTRYLNNDFHPFIYVKDVISRIFKYHNLKIEGELFSDPMYNSLIVTTNNKLSQTRINDRTSFVGKTTTQTISSGSFTKISFIDNVDPYYDGESDLWDNTNFRYVADIDMRINIEYVLNLNVAQTYTIDIRRSGGSIDSRIYSSGGKNSIKGLALNAGQYIEIFLNPATTSAGVTTGSYLQIIPVAFPKIFASDYLPKLSSADFINNIFRMFNVIIGYDPFTKTVIINLFKYVGNKEEIDISEYVKVPKTSRGIDLDYTEFINDFSQKNWIRYADSTEEFIEDYNKANEGTDYDEFGSGYIDVDNFYLPKEDEFISLDFSAAYNYINDCSQISLLKLNFIEESLSDSKNIDSVTDNGGIARFNFSGPKPTSFSAGDVVRIIDDSLTYQGTGVVETSPVGYFELVGVEYKGNATGSFTVITYEESSNNDIIIAVHQKGVLISDISPYSDIYVGTTTGPEQKTSASYAYFSRNNQPGLTINSNLFGLNFGDINDTSFYQIDMVTQFYPNIRDILNDPLKAVIEAELPENVFFKLNPLAPVYINTINICGKFYLEKITGYKNSYTPCVMELIKL